MDQELCLVEADCVNQNQVDQNLVELTKKLLEIKPKSLEIFSDQILDILTRFWID